MVLDGLQPLLAKRFKRLWRNNKTFHYKVNLIRYADDFIITGRDKELLENEVKPIVIEFLKERGLTLSEEKTTITNIYDGFDFLGFNVRKFGKKLYTSPSKDAQKRFRAKISDIVKGHKMCKQESLIRMLNPVITGWGNYYRYGASTDAFHGCDYHIYNLTKKWALQMCIRDSVVLDMLQFLRIVAPRHDVEVCPYRGQSVGMGFVQVLVYPLAVDAVAP